MRSVKPGLLLVMLSLGAAALAADQVFDKDDILGVWKTEPNDDGNYSHVEIFGYVKVAFAKLGQDTVWKRVTAGSE